MVPPPKRVDSVEARNATKHPITFKVSFDNHKDKTEITEEYIVQPGQTHLFKEKVLDMGGWQAVAPVLRVTAEGSAGSQLLTPSVTEVVKVLQVVAAGGDSEGGNDLQLTQTH
ncbi:hypothetical protein VOLCADRAFT_104089 [Volvox carteri f. nagariensis]|uniref:Uncharacterized protein n=1 Tax=Volvox carteri f. nagariensis TaxID=3068 RepID=D8TR66_VOLCA|nr:uncharacterized protein VOLCADRAFT_104089 [Volvox carteri f. nagariensis]EFJ49837.1 hypothetical protein VOLCADRAFT_104089 [Volvox carteri f. nagariensis]|eukprot:XP_002948902.1 hypothetical protein VOLCADRAFT_104089 [Volvox carteri f. nagariensis]